MLYPTEYMVYIYIRNYICKKNVIYSKYMIISVLAWFKTVSERSDTDIRKIHRCAHVSNKKNAHLSEPSDKAKPSIQDTAYEIDDKWLY